MDSYSFYKSLYDRELNRRKDLDTAISLPITILTIIVAANSYMLKTENIIYSLSSLKFKHAVLASLFIALFISAFYIMRSSNNLFKGFAYKNFALIKDIIAYETAIKEYNSNVTNDKAIDFKEVILLKIAEFTDSHIIFNDKRSRDLYFARTYLIISLLLTSVNFLILTLNYIRI